MPDPLRRATRSTPRRTFRLPPSGPGGWRSTQGLKDAGSGNPGSDNRPLTTHHVIPDGAVSPDDPSSDPMPPHLMAATASGPADNDTGSHEGGPHPRRDR